MQDRLRARRTIVNDFPFARDTLSRGEKRGDVPLKISGHTSLVNKGVRNWHEGRSLNHFGPPGQWRNCETTLPVLLRKRRGIATVRSAAEPRRGGRRTRRRRHALAASATALTRNKGWLDPRLVGKDSRVHSGPRSLLRFSHKREIDIIQIAQ